MNQEQIQAMTPTEIKAHLFDLGAEVQYFNQLLAQKLQPKPEAPGELVKE